MNLTLILNHDTSIEIIRYLDYIDLYNLAHVEKAFNHIIYDDSILKRILLKNIGAYMSRYYPEHVDVNFQLPPDLNIAKSLKDIYNSCRIMINKLYLEDEPYTYKIPRWINIPQFKDDITRQLYSGIKYELWDNSMKFSNILKFNIKEIVFPFYAYNCDMYLHETNIDENTFFDNFDDFITVSNETVHYMKIVRDTILEKYKSENLAENLIQRILFIKKYSKVNYGFTY
jgi:hypothetical protein